MTSRGKMLRWLTTFIFGILVLLPSGKTVYTLHAQDQCCTITFEGGSQYTTIFVSHDGTQIAGYTDMVLDESVADYVDYVSAAGQLTFNGSSLPMYFDQYEWPYAVVNIPISTVSGITAYTMTGFSEICYISEEGFTGGVNYGGTPGENLTPGEPGDPGDPGFGDDPFPGYYDSCAYPPGFQVTQPIVPPQITSISPTSVSRGDSGTLTVSGQYLSYSAPYDQIVPTVNLNGSPANQGSDISFTLSGSTPTSLTYNYSVSASASIGDKGLSIANPFGESEPKTLTIGYQPAVITGVSPNVWVAGNDYEVTVTGTGFGSNPSVSAVASLVASGQAYNSSVDGTQTHFHVHVDINAPNEPAQIVVVPGYSGSGYICGNCNGGSPNGNANVDVNAFVPTPMIVRVSTKADQSQCTNASPTQSGQNETEVFAGEQVLLCVNAPAGVNVTNHTWSVRQAADITGGFVSTDATQQPSANAGGREADRPPTNLKSFPFYFLNINGRETVTYTWTLQNGGQASSTADFNVIGPSRNDFSADIQTDNTGTRVTTPTTGNARLGSYNSPSLAAAGINFRALGVLPGGANQSFMWVQILNPQSYSSVSSVGTKDPTQSTASGLDGTYPYGIAGNNNTNDSPNIGLPSSWGEVKKFFDATMYLMWDPALPNGCQPAMTDVTHPGAYTSTPSTCTSIPVPLTSVRWEWSGCAINALSGDGITPDWFRQCGAGVAKQPQANGYPVWTQRIPSDNAP